MDKVQKLQHKFPLLVLATLVFIIVIYYFSYLCPFTTNAFVVANFNEVAADVEGYVTGIYVQNEEYVKKGQPLFTVFQTPYELSYNKAMDDVDEARSYLTVLVKKIEKVSLVIAEQQENYERLDFDYEHNNSALIANAISEIVVNTSMRNKNAALLKLKSLEKQKELYEQELLVQKSKIKSLINVMLKAKVDLDETTVYAQHNGAITGMFVNLGTPIIKHKPIFSLVDTDTLYVQANFNEIDLRKVKIGDKVSIVPRIYLGSKVYHGVISSRNWSSSRLDLHGDNLIQIVKNTQSTWFLLPQRLPVQIKLLDYDKDHYPLNIGETAYVYIHT
jgi:multidrug resistance efflux pump